MGYIKKQLNSKTSNRQRGSRQRQRERGDNRATTTERNAAREACENGSVWSSMVRGVSFDATKYYLIKFHMR